MKQASGAGGLEAVTISQCTTDETETVMKDFLRKYEDLEFKMLAKRCKQVI